MLTNNKRGKSRYTSDYTIKNCHNYYKEKYKDNKSLKISYSDYVMIYKTFIKKALLYVLEDSMDFKLFSRLGIISIRKRKIKKKLDKNGNLINVNRPVDWGTTLKYWNEKYGITDKEELKKIKNKKVIYHNNKNTNGYTLKLWWDKFLCNVPNQSKYVFKGCRDLDRSIKKVNDLKNIEYYEAK